jgi:hypothetical protein
MFTAERAMVEDIVIESQYERGYGGVYMVRFRHASRKRSPPCRRALTYPFPYGVLSKRPIFYVGGWPTWLAAGRRFSGCFLIDDGVVVDEC